MKGVLGGVEGREGKGGEERRKRARDVVFYRHPRMLRVPAQAGREAVSCTSRYGTEAERTKVARKHGVGTLAIRRTAQEGTRFLSSRMEWKGRGNYTNGDGESPWKQ